MQYVHTCNTFAKLDIALLCSTIRLYQALLRLLVCFCCWFLTV